MYIRWQTEINGFLAGTSSSHHSGRIRSTTCMDLCCWCSSYWLLSLSVSPSFAHTSCWMPRTIDGLCHYSLWPPCEADADIIFLPWFLLLLFFLSSPNLSRRILDVYHTSKHGVALVRI